MARLPKYSDEFYLKHLPTAVAIPGMTCAIIAKKLGMSTAGVSKVLRKFNIAPPRAVQLKERLSAMAARGAAPTRPNAKSRMWNDRTEEVYTMLHDGNTIADIARHYGVAYHTMYRWSLIYTARKWKKLDLPPA